MQTISPYNVLNIHPNCTLDEVKNQFKKLAVQYHPDKGGDTAEFRRAQEAHEVMAAHGQAERG